jgi:ribosomal protein S18 acetylase RimI-like enzyme
MYMLVCDGETVSAAVINDEQDDEYNSVDWKYKGERAGVIHRLCVSPSHQQRGYGKETVLRSGRVMKEAGYTAVRLDAFSQNPSALKLYEGLGYERVGEVTFRKGRFFVYEKLLRDE